MRDEHLVIAVSARRAVAGRGLARARPAPPGRAAGGPRDPVRWPLDLALGPPGRSSRGGRRRAVPCASSRRAPARRATSRLAAFLKSAARPSPSSRFRSAALTALASNFFATPSKPISFQARASMASSSLGTSAVGRSNCRLSSTAWKTGSDAIALNAASPGGRQAQRDRRADTSSGAPPRWSSASARPRPAPRAPAAALGRSARSAARPSWSCRAGWPPARRTPAHRACDPADSASAAPAHRCESNGSRSLRTFEPSSPFSPAASSRARINRGDLDLGGLFIAASRSHRSGSG